MNLPPARPGARVTTISLTVEALPDGRYRLSTPHARGWAAEVRTQAEYARATLQAFDEVAIASYARAKGRAYDLEVATDPQQDTPVVRRSGRADGRAKAMHHPGDWTKMEDGRWKSPAGRMYSADTKQVKGVITARLERGMTV